jgi:SAM-dependent methyltransferase
MPEMIEALHALNASTRYNRWVYDSIARYLSGAVLDIGSGIGNVAQFYSEHPCVTACIVSDRAEALVAFLRQRFSHKKNHRVAVLDISKDFASFDILPHSIDTITLINVLEHIEDDIDALKKAHLALRESGTLVLHVPAFPALYGSLDVVSGHYRRYDRRALKERLNACGFTIREMRYFNLCGLATWFLGGRVLRQRKFGGPVYKILDACLPIASGIEQHFRPCIGQSLIAVCTA